LAVSVALIIQAIVFGDGGITAIGANCFNMAVVMPFVSYWAFKLIKGDANNGARFYVAAFLAGWIGLSVAATLTGFEFGIQPLLASGPDGKPLYAPYPLSVAVPAMALEHMLLFGLVEGMVTALVLKYFVKHESGLVYATKEA
jgi:cobalt/nickel transport system permease protein